jgi:hypothetical protein
MKFSFIVLLVAVIGYMMYAPKSGTRTGAPAAALLERIKNVAPSSAALPGVQPEQSEEQSESVRNLKTELGIDPSKPLVEVEVVNPAMEQVQKASTGGISSGAAGIASQNKDFYRSFTGSTGVFLKEYGDKFTLFAVLTVIIALVAKLVEIYRVAYFIASFGWIVSRFALFVISAAAISGWFMFKENLWSSCGWPLFAAPLGIFAASAAALKILDYNFPVWNRALASLVLPAISGIIVSL